MYSSNIEVTEPPYGDPLPVIGLDFNLFPFMLPKTPGCGGPQAGAAFGRGGCVKHRVVGALIELVA